MTRAFSSLLLAFTLAVAIIAPVQATHIRHVHAGQINNIEGPCDVTWEHINYTDNYGLAYTDELSSCDNVQAVVRWYQSGLGYVTYYGPQQNLYSSISSGDVLSLLWSRHCGNATCSGQLS